MLRTLAWWAAGDGNLLHAQPPARSTCCTLTLLHAHTPLPPVTPVIPCRLLGAGVEFGAQTDWGRWEAGMALDPAGLRPWLFVAQQKRLSLQEMGIYEDHVEAAEAVDEDFFGNFS